MQWPAHHRPLHTIMNEAIKMDILTVEDIARYLTNIT